MANFENDLAQYESPLGIVAGETLRLWKAEVPEFDTLYDKLITEPVKYRGQFVPAGYVGKRGNATPVKSQMISLIVALAKHKFEKRYSQKETVDLLVLAGVSLSKAGLGKVLARVSGSLGLSNITPKKGRIVEIRNLADAENLVQRERKAFAKKAKKDGLTGEQVNEALHKKRTKAQGPVEPSLEKKIELDLEDSDDDFAGREIVYTPTPKQVLFHAASEKIVLYGGAAG